MPTVVIGNNTGDDFSGTECTRLAETAATTNYGTSSIALVTKFAANDDKNTVIAFSGLSSLPSPLSVSSAIFSFYLTAASGASGQIITLRRLLLDWVENEATWNIYSTGNNWNTAGGLSDGNDRSATTSDTMSNVTNTTGQYYDSDDLSQMQSDVEDFVDGTLNNYGWHLERTDGADDSTYRRFETDNGSDGQFPYLTVIYTEAGGVTIPIMSHHYTKNIN